MAYLVSSLQDREGTDKAEKEFLGKLDSLSKPKTATESDDGDPMDLMAIPIPGLREAPLGIVE